MKPLGITLRDLSFAEASECARAADDAGIHSVWIPESAGDRDATTVLAGLAIRTQRVGLATGVLAVQTRHPVQMAMTARTLAETSGGRFILGLGSGNANALGRMGVTDTRRPLLHVEEFVGILRSGRSGYDVSFDGQVYKIPGVRQKTPPPPSVIPIYVAAHNQRMLRLAGRFGDGVLLNMISPEEVKRSIGFVREGAAGRSNGAPAIASYVLTCLGPKREALKTAKVVLASFCNSEVFRIRLEAARSPYADVAAAAHRATVKVGPDAATRLISEDMANEFAVIGETKALDLRLGEYRAAGIDLPILSIFPTPLRLKQFFPPLPESGTAHAIKSVLSRLDANA